MKKTLMALMLGTALVMAPVRGYAVDGKTQSTIFYAMGAASIALDVLSWALEGWTVHINFDIPNELLDVYEYMVAKDRQTFWSGIPEELQAQMRKIGGFEDLEGYGEDEYLSETDVHVMALENTGIEALYDDGKEPLKTAAANCNPAMLQMIQTQFGTPHLTDATSTTSTASDIGGTGLNLASVTDMMSSMGIDSSMVTSALSAFGLSGLTGTGTSGGTSTTVSATALAGALNQANLTTSQKQELLRAGYSKEDREKQLARRAINNQKVGVNGVARSELLQSVCKTDNSKERIDQLQGVVGKGESLSGQAKIYAGLELEFCSRLNMTNMAQGSMLAIDAANALRRVE